MAMSFVNSILLRTNRCLTIAGVAVARFRVHRAGALRVSGVIVSVLTFMAAVMCVVGIVVLAGYDHTLEYKTELKYVLMCCQLIFVTGMVYKLVFDFNRIFRSKKLIKWILDIAMVVTLVPLLWRYPDNPWMPWLADVVYSGWFMYGVLLSYSVIVISYGMIRAIGKRTNPSLLLSGSFILIILVGSLLLLLPRCTYVPIGYSDALFVSTSAVCITGLTPVDIYSTFTPFGQLILLILVQIGCLGLMTFTSFFALFFSGDTSIYSQLMLKDIVYSRSMSALIPTLRYIFAFTVTVEAVGALLVYVSVSGTTGMTYVDELWFSVFHSVSAFSNAGFSVVTHGLSNPVFLYGNLSVYWITTFLVIAGAIGFPILVNFKDTLMRHISRFFRRVRHKPVGARIIHNYNMNTRVVLATFFLLFAAGGVLFFVLEYNNSLSGMSLAEKVTQAVFNSATPRSAGFSSVNPSGFLPSTLIVVMFLMWIGGGSQSTAGGIKVNTFAAICLNLRSIVTGRSSVTAFSRTISVGSIRRANAVVAISLLSYFFYATVLVIMEPELPTKDLLFEALSALFTVGSSLGVTSKLSPESEILLCTAMFLGRVGIISLLTGIARQKRNGGARFPNDVIIIS